MADTKAGRPDPGAQQADLTRLARGGALNLAGALVSSAVNVLLVVAVTQQVSKSRAGVFFAAISVFLIVATVAKLGANTGLVYFVSRLRALGRPDLIGARLRSALPAVAAAAVLLGALLWVFAGAIGDAVIRGHSAPAGTYIRILAVFLPTAALADVSLAATRGYRRMQPTVALDLVARPALQLGLTVLVLALHAPLAWLAVAWAAPYLPEMLAALFWLHAVRRRDRSAATSTTGAGLGTADFWKFTGPRAVTSVVHLALQRLDIVLVAALRGPADAALYTAATRFLVVGQLGSQAISTVVQPRLSELLAVRDLTGAKAVYQVATGWLVLVTWPLYLLSLVFSTKLLGLFGRGYAAGSRVIVLLALAMLVATMCGMVDVVLNMAGRTTWTLANSVLALGIMVGLDLLLIPRYGIVGAAIGWAASILANNLVPLGQVVVWLRLHPFGAGTWRAAALASVCFGALPLGIRWLAGPNTTALGLSVLLGSATFLVACYRLQRRLSLDVLRDLWRRQRRRPLLAASGTP